MTGDTALVEEMRDALGKRRGITEQRMFGGYCWMLNGNMLSGVRGDRFMFRVGKDLEAEALARSGASPMDITGRPMPGIVWVDAVAAREAGIDDWIDFAARFVGGLPPKEKKPKAAKNRA